MIVQSTNYIVYTFKYMQNVYFFKQNEINSQYERVSTSSKRYGNFEDLPYSPIHASQNVTQDRSVPRLCKTQGLSHNSCKFSDNNPMYKIRYGSIEFLLFYLTVTLLSYLLLYQSVVGQFLFLILFTFSPCLMFFMLS